MKCCANCFEANEPRKIIEEQDEINDCDFCGKSRVPTAESEVLKPLFEPVLEYYELVEYQKHYIDPEADPSDYGESLGFLLQDHWGIFSDEIDSADKCNELIEAICDVKAQDLWCTLEDRWYVEPDEDRSAWSKFASYLKTKRRFLLNFSDAGISDLMRLLPTVLEEFQVALTEGTTLFRSRLGGENNGSEVRPYSVANMGAPPPDLNNQGRGNPPGISRLYVASDEETAVGEKRPARKSLLSVVKLETTKKLSLIDLADVTYLKSPFGVEFLSYEIRARRLLRVLGSELSRPVSIEDSPSEYLPSQFLCEFILDSGYDGVIYGSGYGSGKNYLIFDTKAAVPQAPVKLVKVKDSKVSFNSGDIYDIWDDRLE